MVKVTLSQKKIDQTQFRKIIGYNTFKLHVDYTRNLMKAAKAGKYHYCDPKLIDFLTVPPLKQMPSKLPNSAEIEIKLIHFGIPLESEEVIKKLNKMKLRPANIYELLAFGENFPKKQIKFTIVALGTIWQELWGNRYVASLSGSTYRGGSERRLSHASYEGIVWDERTLFAVVAK